MAFNWISKAIRICSDKFALFWSANWLVIIIIFIYLFIYFNYLFYFIEQYFPEVL